MHPGLPCAMFYGLYGLSSGTGVLAPVIRGMRKHHRELGVSSGTPGPHDFTVRKSAFVRMAETTLRALASIASRAQRS
jgi:hypothetical protein